MKKAFKKIFSFIFLAFLAGNCAQAINSEFKNTLTGVELTKTGEENYNINLYTAKKFSSPIRIIKKSDLSYYILLPETNNATSQVNVISPDIRNISTNMYPYAGVDVYNGYTKININTTKPINFSVNTKSNNAQKTASTSTLANNTKIQTSLNKEEKSQKKNSEIQKTPLAQKQSSQPQKEVKKEPTTSVNKVSEAKKEQQKAAPLTKSLSVKSTVNKVSASKTQVVKSSKNKYTENKTAILKSKTRIETAKKQTVKSDKTAFSDEKKSYKAPEQNYMAAAKLDLPEKNIEKQSKPEEIIQKEELKPSESIVQQEEKVENTVPQEEQKNSFEKEQTVIVKNISIGNAFKKFKNVVKNTVSASKNKLLRFSAKSTNKLAEYGLSLGDLIFIILAGIFTFTATLLILNRNQNQPKIKSKADLTDKKESPFTPKSSEENNTGNNEGQYFVFEKNIRQTELLEPAASEEKKNYELVSYDPDLRENYTESEKVQNQDEDLDIIHKILKEDSFIELDAQGKPKEQNILTEQKEAVSEPVKQFENVTSPIGQEHVKKEVEIQKENILQEETPQKVEQSNLEPKLLSSKAISPEQGFMLISYQNNINLMGYIFDDVFALYNFKVQELNNYNIEARLVDKDEQGSIYIVKADGARMLIKATKTTMSTEVIL